jgi:hypothetical protein
MKTGAHRRGRAKQWHACYYETWLDFGKEAMNALPLACYLRRVIVDNSLAVLRVNVCYHLKEDGSAYTTRWCIDQRPSLGPAARSICRLLPRIAPVPTDGALLSLQVRCHPNERTGDVYVEVTPDYL